MKKKIKLLSFILPMLALFSIAAVQTWRNVDATGTFRGAFVVTATTNQFTFGATNVAPVTTTSVVDWISVKITGRTNVYRLPLYQ